MKSVFLSAARHLEDTLDPLRAARTFHWPTEWNKETHVVMPEHSTRPLNERDLKGSPKATQQPMLLVELNRVFRQ